MNHLLAMVIRQSKRKSGYAAIILHNNSLVIY